MDGIFHIGFESEGLNSGVWLARCARSASRDRAGYLIPLALRRRGPSMRTMVNARENGKIDRGGGLPLYAPVDVYANVVTARTVEARGREERATRVRARPGGSNGSISRDGRNDD